jgi:hypothetical protein
MYMRNRLLVTIAGLILVVILACVPLSGIKLVGTTSTIPDISWPNCKATYGQDVVSGIIGVNGGLDFSPNHCLYNESKLFSTYSLYLNTGYPGASYGEEFSSYPLSCSSSDTLCLAYNYGFNAASYAISYADIQSVHSSMWWLDVETANSWSVNVLQNRAALSGMVAAIKQYTFLPTIGFYSYPGQWDAITGGWRNHFPVWTATGSESYKVAVSFCKGNNFTGGNTWLAQYTLEFDYNYTCNGNYLAHEKISL